MIDLDRQVKHGCIHFIRANPGLLQMMLGLTASEKRKVVKLADLEKKIIKILEAS